MACKIVGDVPGGGGGEGESPELLRLRAFAQDVAYFGVRADLTPTRSFDHDAVAEWMWWSQYIKGAENSLRQAAKYALEGNRND